MRPSTNPAFARTATAAAKAITKALRAALATEKEKYDEVFKKLIQGELCRVPTSTRLFLATTLQFL
jgi:hypothetical protein